MAHLHTHDGGGTAPPAQGWTTTLDRDTVAASARGQGAVMVWVELANLAADHGAIAGHGVLRTLLGSLLTTAPLVFCIAWRGAP
jgi:hypothetical protein